MSASVAEEPGLRTKAYWSAHQVLAFSSPGIAGLGIAIIIRAFWPTFKSFGGMSTALLALLCVVLHEAR